MRWGKPSLWISLPVWSGWYRLWNSIRKWCGNDCIWNGCLVSKWTEYKMFWMFHFTHLCNRTLEILCSSWATYLPKTSCSPRLSSFPLAFSIQTIALLSRISSFSCFVFLVVSFSFLVDRGLFVDLMSLSSVSSDNSHSTASSSYNENNVTYNCLL